MGKIKLGVMDDVRGKVGKVIGGVWNGISYLRAIPSHVKNPNTLAQQKQRLRFKLTAELMSSLSPVINYGFATGEGGRTPVNRALSFNISHILTGEFPDYEIDYSKLVIARGKLSGIYDATVSGDTWRTVRFTWEHIEETGNAKDDDRILLLVIDVDKGVPIYRTEDIKRADEEAEFTIPKSFTGDTFEAYLAVTRRDGSIAADSLYLGSFTATDQEPSDPDPGEGDGDGGGDES